MVETLEGRRLMAVSLTFDYSLDSLGFFTADRRSALESTLNAIAARLGDSLAPVASASYTLDLAAGARTVTTSVPANVIKVYAYGDNLTGTGSVAQGGAYYSPGANDSMRGQGANDYAPDIAYMRFDASASSNWYIGSSLAGLGYSQIDFMTVARHEFLHSLGFLDSQPTFARYDQNNQFFGPYAEAANSGLPVPLDGSHVASSVTSIMNPVTILGTRSDLTNLEWGFLKDFGWTVLAAPTLSAPYFDRDFHLFLGGQGNGQAMTTILPANGVYLMPIDVLGGDSLRLQTLDGSTSDLQGADGYLKLFDSAGNLLARNNDSASGGKEDFSYTFTAGGRYYVGVSAAAQSDYTFTTPSSAAVSTTGFLLKATLTGATADEPHDIASATSSVTLAGGLYDRTTTLAGVAADVFRLDALAGYTYVISTSLPTAGGLSGPTVATIYDAAGRKVVGMSGASSYDRLSWTAQASGTYYVRVARTAGASVVTLSESLVDPGFSTPDSGDGFSISGTRSVGGDYRLTISATAPTPPPNRNPLYVDYGSSGLWRWSESAGWRQLIAADPQDFVTAADGSVFVDFGGFGTWRWSESGGWQSLRSADPQQMAAASDGSVYFDYGSEGLWRWTAAAGFARVNAADPQGIATGPGGVVYVDYGQFGLWRWTAAAGMRQINAADPESMVAGTDGVLYIDYGKFGLWKWTEASGMSQINTADAQSMVAGPGGSLYVDLGSSGLWQYSAGAFRQIIAADPEGVVAAADGWLYIDFGRFGVYRWAAYVGMQQINAADPQKLAVLAPST
ncbi:pre-peptidase C-terminal domain-containing protein [Paludisphaera rhizosphaerae]|uniref:pre-peptidase C-terminal domain-containing protein n=1 Tax=Paludisphaera rhizosphaerae TaxID=2711216 RepID=UPI0013ED95DE|nr:pre-peptidase C-terminal domain-containing protein [Paludisphaera rhizosphaerae]